MIGFKRAFRVAGQDYRQELAVLRDAHREEMTKLARFYDEQLASLSADFAVLARAHHEDVRRRAVAEAVAERERCSWKPLH